LKNWFRMLTLTLKHKSYFSFFFWIFSLISNIECFSLYISNTTQINSTCQNCTYDGNLSTPFISFNQTNMFLANNQQFLQDFIEVKLATPANYYIFSSDFSNETYKAGHYYFDF